MHSSVRRICSIAAMLFLVLGFASSAQATGFNGGINWQEGDVIICGSGTCNVVRIVTGSPVLLDQFSGGLLLDNRGVAINNTLHAVVTDNGGGGDSKVVVYTIASVNPINISPTVIAHSPVTTPFNGSGGSGSGNAQAVVVAGNGHIFVGNAGSGDGAVPSIVELNPDGTRAIAFPTGSLSTNPLPLTGCADIAGRLLSMDLNKNGLSMYLTTSDTSYKTSTSNGGHIQKITLSTGACNPFASFGPGVALNGIQDVPPGALAAVTSCKGTPCPTSRDTILVVAEGFFDSDGDPGAGELVNGIPDSGDDVNICTNAVDQTLVSCALLLDTDGPGLTAAPWVAGTPYPNTGVPVLDANLHVQQVATPGTSGTYAASPFHPAWNEGGTDDNRVTWTDGGPADPGPADWAPNTAYCSTCTAGTQIRDSVTGHIQNATTPGTSGPASARPAFKINGGTTQDGLSWTDQGTSVVARYPVTGKSTLQALSLDPLVSDCTVVNCSSSVPPPTTSNFWLGDNSSANFYKLDFATGANGAPTALSANANIPSPPGGPCGTCSTVTGIQGLRIYGGEGANQAGLTKLASDSLSSSNNFTGIAQFPLPVDSTNTNSLTVTQGGTPSGSTPFAIYGSLVSGAARTGNGGNNSGASDVGSLGTTGFALSPPPPCQPTTSDFTKCIVWKIDVPAGLAQTLPANTFLDTSFQGPSNPVSPPAGVTAGIDNGTHVFLDEHYDVTSFVGTFDPGGTYKPPSVWSLQEVAATFSSGSSGNSGCFYIIAGVNTPPANACFKNGRTTLPIEFQCPNVPTFTTVVQNPPGPPQISILQGVPFNSGPKPAPQPIQLTGTNNKAPYRFNGTDDIFNWAIPTVNKQPIKGFFDVCTLDPTGTVQGLCTKIKLDPTCK